MKARIVFKPSGSVWSQDWVDPDGEPLPCGWYWIAGGPPNGPFDTKEQAEKDSKS